MGNGSVQGTDDAVLVSVEGNTYLSVPILGFGSEKAEEADKGEGRMPWLSTLHPFGDTSSLSRFIIGLDEALRDYRGSEEAPLLRSPGPSQDPWNEDLFYRRLPVPPQVLGREKRDPTGGGSPGAMLPDPHQEDRGTPVRPGEGRFDEPGVRPSSFAARIVAGLTALAGLLAATLLTPVRSGSVPRRSEGPDDRVPAKATRDGESRADLPSSEPER
jgi:hypothetical protein